MKKVILLILALLLGAFIIANAQISQGITKKIGTVYWAIDDSTGLKSIYEVWNNQCPPCPPNIYIHDTMWEIPGGYSSVRPAKPPVPTHDTIIIPCTLPTLTSIFTTQTLPTVGGNDGKGIELGVKFRTSVSGYIRGIRFYKLGNNGGTHLGELYTAAGARLAQATFTGETTTGWQTVQFATPIPVIAGVTYVAAYFSPTGGYSGTTGGFANGITNGPVTGLADGTDGPNGVYTYSATPVFPTSSYQKTNYWVDIIYSNK